MLDVATAWLGVLNMKQSSYLVALPVTPFIIGPFTGKSSLHCTLMHWFTLSPVLPEEQLVEFLFIFGLNPVMENIELEADYPDLFGPNSDVPVCVLKRNEALLKAHGILKKFLESQMCVLPRSDWVGDFYRPHVSLSSLSDFDKDLRHKACSLVLIKKDIDDGKSVIFQTDW